MNVWVSARADRLNQQDRVDMEALGEQAVCNGGDAYVGFIYHAHVVGNDVYVTTQSEEQKGE